MIASVASIVVVFLVHYVLGFLWEPAASTLRVFFLGPGKLFREDSQLFLGVVLPDLLANCRAVNVREGTLYRSITTEGSRQRATRNEEAF